MAITHRTEAKRTLWGYKLTVFLMNGKFMELLYTTGIQTPVVQLVPQ